jgi:two-component system phosphate regulon sensor histidine kinase PhoR
VRRGVFIKLLAAFFLVIAVATLTFGFRIYSAWTSSLQTELRRSLVERTRLFAQQLQNNKDRPLQQVAAEAAAAADARVTVIDRSGRVLADSQADAGAMENHAERPEFAAALRGQVGQATRTSHTVGIPFLYVAVPFPGGAVRLASPLADEKQTRRVATHALLTSAAAALALAMVLAALVAQMVARRLRRIVAFAERIAAGDLSARIAQSSSDEVAVVADALDRTARKLEQSFAAIETSRRQLETLLNSMQDAVMAVRGDGRVLWVNGRMQKLAGAGVRVGAPAVQTIRDPSFLAALEGAVTRQEICVARVTALLPGRVFQVTAAPMPLLPDSGSGMPNSMGGVAVLHDLSDVERVEKTRRDFIANVSHELRTPLTSVQGYTETLLEACPAWDTNSREFLEIILKNAARMSRLTEDLLVLARVESGEQRFAPRPVEAADLLQDAVDTFSVAAQEQGLEIVVENNAADPVLADPEAIHQVLSNLMRNAINYAREGGKLVLGARPAGDAVEFYVRDFGPGIASEHLPRLFERFYRVDKARSRESGGTGLGLAIVKHIVRAHNGEVRAESRLGHGSTFYFTIPLAPTEEAAVQPVAPPVPPGA